MNDRNGSFASKVDRMVVPEPKSPMERAKADAYKSKPKSIKGPKSPGSSKSAFNDKTPKSAPKQSRQTKGYFTPAPGREPRPHGMGEKAVNWRVHNMRMKMLRDTTKGSFTHASGSKAQFKAKAAKLEKASKKYERGKPAHIKDQHKDHSR
jgi:hypothetical protein